MVICSDVSLVDAHLDREVRYLRDRLSLRAIFQVREFCKRIEISIRILLRGITGFNIP